MEMPHHKPPMTGERGFTLLQIVIAIALGTILLAAGAALMTNSTRMQRHLLDKSDRGDLELWLLSSLDCAETLGSATSCAPGVSLPLKRKVKATGAVVEVLPALGARRGSFAVRADCNAAGDGIVVRAVRLAKGAAVTSTMASDFLPDQATGKVTTWSDPDAVLLHGSASGGAGAEVCSFAEVGPMRSAAAVAPVRATHCAGALQGGYCSQYWYQDVVFARPFARPPAVTVTLAVENPGCACGCTVDNELAYAVNVTRSGFRMICATSPNNDPVGPAKGCPVAGHGDWWNYGDCSWVAYEQ